MRCSGKPSFLLRLHQENEGCASGRSAAGRGMWNGFGRRIKARSTAQIEPRLRPENGNDTPLNTHENPSSGTPRPCYVKRMLRQVSWLSGHHALPAFPVFYQWQEGAKIRRLQLRGQPRISSRIKNDSAPDSLLIPNEGEPSTAGSILTRNRLCQIFRCVPRNPCFASAGRLSSI